MKDYKTIKADGDTLTIIEKSKFITYTKSIKTQEEAQNYIKEIKKKHYDANHNVWAYVLGEDMDVQRYSDDGEPSGTAGIPTLDVLRKLGVTDTCIIVTRYFGGIKLGAGGLVRAYSKCAKAGIDNVGIVEKKVFSILELEVEYSLVGKIQQETKDSDLILLDTEYMEKVKFIFCVLPDYLEKTNDYFVELTNGNCKTSFVGNKLLTIDFKGANDEYCE